ncbi:DUF222 domain-containing protein, partial [Glaciibacter psychrotolerans]
AAAATDAEDAAAESGDASHADDPGAVDAEAGPPPGAPSALSWLAEVSAALNAGTLSADATAAIRKGLGETGPGVSAEKLHAAAVLLIGEARTLSADTLWKRARVLRDQLDIEGISRREKTQHGERFFRLWKQPNGMYRTSGLFAPEQGRQIELIVEGITGPRRGGPRFVDPTAHAKAQALRDDPRTTDQIAADGILTLLHLGTEA